MQQTNDSFDMFALQKFPADGKRIFLTVFAVGFFAYGFSMSNMLLGQDNSLIWYDNFSSVQDLLAFSVAGRWLANAGLALFGTVNMPWWTGIWSLLLLSVAAFVTSRTFKIRAPWLQVVLAGVMTVNPYVVSAYNYLPSAPSYMLALLFACLAPYFLQRYRWGAVPAFLCMMLTDALYTTYLSVSVCWIILLVVQKILQNPGNTSNVFKKEVYSMFLAAASLAVTLGICQLIVHFAGLNAQDRVLRATSMGLRDYVDKIISTYSLVLYRLFSNWKSSYMQGIPCMLLRIVVVLAFILALLLFYKAKLWRYPEALLILACNIFVLPLGIDLIGILQTSHSLMGYAYITPLVLCIVLLSNVLELQAFPRAFVFGRILPFMVVGCNLLYVLCFAQLANKAASFRYVQYESATQLATRIVDRLESQADYIPGVTPVLITGKFPESYYYTDGEWGRVAAEPFAELKNIEGANAWMAFTYQECFEYMVTQVLGTKLNLLHAESASGGSTSFSTDLKELIARIQQDNPTVTQEELQESLNTVDAFPAQNCCVWVEDVLVLKMDLGQEQMYL